MEKHLQYLQNKTIQFNYYKNVTKRYLNENFVSTTKCGGTKIRKNKKISVSHGSNSFCINNFQYFKKFNRSYNFKSSPAQMYYLLLGPTHHSLMIATK